MDYESPEYHLKRHPDLIRDAELSLAWSAFADNAYFSHVNKDDHVLEFGSGVASNLLTIKNKVSRLIAIEPSVLGREIAEKHGIESHDSIEGVAGEKFDTILCRHVLEHVEKPLEVLRSLKNHLTEDGILVLVLPVDPLFQRPKENDLNQHLYCWNPRTIHNLAMRVGLTPASYHYETYGAKKVLLPIYRKFGANTYIRLVRLVGKLFRFQELVYIFTQSNLQDSEQYKLKQ